MEGMNKKLLTILFVIILLIVTLTTVALTKKDTNTVPPQQSGGVTTDPAPSEPLKPGEYGGKIVCLPKKGDGPHTLECAMGLQADDGKFYALKNAQLGSISTDAKVAVKGKLAAPSPTSTYDIAGEIAVEEIREIR